MKRGLIRLPGLESCNTGLPRFLPMDKVHLFFGETFYNRLNMIYSNVCEAIVNKNMKYISSVMAPELAATINQEISEAERNRFRIKLKQPLNKASNKKSKSYKYLRLRQTIWSNGISRIGMFCNVHFGLKFDPTQTNISKGLKISKYRYLHYQNELSLQENLKNMYQNQIFQLNVKIASKMYLQLYNYDMELLNDQGNKEVFTEMVLQTSNSKFNWIITNINNLNKNI